MEVERRTPAAEEGGAEVVAVETETPNSMEGAVVQAQRRGVRREVQGVLQAHRARVGRSARGGALENPARCAELLADRLTRTVQAALLRRYATACGRGVVLFQFPPSALLANAAAAGLTTFRRAQVTG